MSKLTTLVKTTLTPIALCLSLAIAVPAIAKKGHHQKHDGMRQIFSELSLTDAQKQDIKLIFKQTREDRGVLSTDAKSLKKELRSLVQRSEWDQTAVESAIVQQQALIQENALQRASNKNQVWNLLTETQQSEFITQLETRKAKFKSKGKKGNRKGKRNGNGKNVKRLDLTTQQRAAVKAIKTAAKESGKEIKAKLKSFKQAERSLIHSTEFNPVAWQTLNTKYQADFVAMAMLKAKSKHDIWNLMTAQQQANALKNSKKGKRGKKGKQQKRSEAV